MHFISVFNLLHARFMFILRVLNFVLMSNTTSNMNVLDLIISIVSSYICDLVLCHIVRCYNTISVLCLDFTCSRCTGQHYTKPVWLYYKKVVKTNFFSFFFFIFCHLQYLA